MGFECFPNTAPLFSGEMETLTNGYTRVFPQGISKPLYQHVLLRDSTFFIRSRFHIVIAHDCRSNETELRMPVA